VETSLRLRQLEHIPVASNALIVTKRYQHIIDPKFFIRTTKYTNMLARQVTWKQKAKTKVPQSLQNGLVMTIFVKKFHLQQISRPAKV
jgi:hypothetical protein